MQIADAFFYLGAEVVCFLSLHTERETRAHHYIPRIHALIYMCVCACVRHNTLQALLSMRLDVQLRCCQNFEAANQGSGGGVERRLCLRGPCFAFTRPPFAHSALSRPHLCLCEMFQIASPSPRSSMTPPKSCSATCARFGAKWSCLRQQMGRWTRSDPSPAGRPRLVTAALVSPASIHGFVVVLSIVAGIHSLPFRLSRQRRAGESAAAQPRKVDAGKGWAERRSKTKHTHAHHQRASNRPHIVPFPLSLFRSHAIVIATITIRLLG